LSGRQDWLRLVFNEFWKWRNKRLVVAHAAYVGVAVVSGI
jgi:hypothetical protein